MATSTCCCDASIVTAHRKLRNFLYLALLASAALQAQEGQQEDSTTPPPDEARSLAGISEQLVSPISSLFSFTTRYEFETFQGDLPESGGQDASQFQFTTSLPIRFDSGQILQVRLMVPMVMEQPNWVVYFDDPIWELDRDYPDWLLRQSPQVTASTGEFVAGHGHLADIELDVAYGGTSDSGVITMFGLVATFPTSQDFSAGRDQYLLGPEIALGLDTDWGVAGGWLTHRVNVAGTEKSFDTNETLLKGFFAYGLENGWQLTSNPEIIYDWEADSGNEWVVPLTAGVSKITRWGRVPIRFELEFNAYIISPDRFGPEWLVSFSFTPVFRTPFGE